MNQKLPQNEEFIEISHKMNQTEPQINKNNKKKITTTKGPK